MKKNRIWAAAETFIFFIIVFFLVFSDVLYFFDNMLCDRLYQNPRGINNKIKIIAIDDKPLSR